MKQFPVSLSGKDATSVMRSLKEMLRNTSPQSRATPYSPILYGKYTVNGDGFYNLDGFGTVTVKADNNGAAAEWVIARNGQEPAAYHASVQNDVVNSSISNKLCRTWAWSNSASMPSLV